MPRFEIGVLTPLRFVKAIEEVDDVFTAPTDSVEIEFDGRPFAWHDGSEEHDPSVAVEHDDSRSTRAEANELTQRLLSAIAFVTEVPLASWGFGHSVGGPGLWHNPTARPPRSSRGLRRRVAPARVDVLPDQRLRQALALLREGTSSESPFYRFLCYWNALDVAMPDKVGRAALIDTVGPQEWARHRSSGPMPPSLSKYMWESSRNAVAHAVRAARPEVDADLPADRMRLVGDTRVLYPIVREAFKRRWPSGVTFVDVPAE